MTYAVFVFYALAQAADVYTTQRAMKAGGVESNPAIRWAMDKFGSGWIVVKIALSAIAAALFFNANAIWGIWIIGAVVAAVAANNLRIALKMESRK